jgi:hypothetical protein
VTGGRWRVALFYNWSYLERISRYKRSVAAIYVCLRWHKGYCDAWVRGGRKDRYVKKNYNNKFTESQLFQLII